MTIHSHFLLPSLVFIFTLLAFSFSALAAEDRIIPDNTIVHEVPRELDTGFAFMAPDETTHFLLDYAGKYVLINLWATWCPPCVVEMPSLDRLQKKMEGYDLVIIPLSMGDDSLLELWDFFDKLGIRNLMPYESVNSLAVRRLFPDVRGLPTTMLIDPQGREIAVMEGDFEWDSPEMMEFLRSYLVSGDQTDSANASSLSAN